MADLFTLPAEADHFNLTDLVTDDWLGPAVNATDLTDFPDDAIAASLAAFSGRDEDEGEHMQAVLPDRLSTRSPGLMRSSYSMNDLTSLQQQPMPSPWNHKLVSMKPKLQPVPEGTPSNGGPLNLLPLSTGLSSPHGLHHMPHSNGNGHLSGHAALGMPTMGLPNGAAPVAGAAMLSPGHNHPAPMPMPHHGNPNNPHAGIPGLDSDLEDFVDFDSDEAVGGMHRQLPSTGSLTQQLQMTHVRSDRQLAALDTSPGRAQHHAFGHLGGDAQMYQGSTGALQQSAQVSLFQGDSMVGGPPEDLFSQEGMGVMDLGQQGGPSGVGPSGAPTLKRPSPTGLPLRKSQSAVELGSWRSFSGGDEMWELEALAGVDAMGKPFKLTPEERMARINRYREKRVQRSYGRAGPTGTTAGGVKYTSRKAVADTRPRVRGRFARPDEVGVGADVLMMHKLNGVMPGSPAGSVGAHTSSGGGPSSSGGLGGGGSGGLVASQSSHHGATSAPSFGVMGGPTMLSAAGRTHSMPPLPPAPMPGISVIGATPTPMLQPDMVTSVGMGMGPLAVPSTHGPPVMAGSFPPMPAVVGPSSGGLGIAGGSMPQGGMVMPPGGMLPLPYMSAGQTIFTSQTLFGPAGPCQGSAGVQGRGVPPMLGHPPSGTSSAHPSVSPPLHAVSPAHSDSQSHSVGLSLGDFSTG